MELFEDDVKARLARLGLEGSGGYGKWSTDHMGWSRIFVSLPQEDGQPLSLGHAVLRDGKYQHMKWYGQDRCTGSHVGENAYYHYAWEYLERSGRVLTRGEWRCLVERALEKAQAIVQAKRDWREANPKPNGGRRARLAPPNPHRFLREALYPSVAQGG